MHTKLKGSIGELIVAEAFLQRGWRVAFPYGENQKYDLIVEKDGVCKRVQVKAVNPKGGVLHINCFSSNNWSLVRYDKKDFELLVAVNLNNKKVYFIPSDQLNRSLLYLRIEPSKNNQKKKIKLAKDWEILTF